MFRVRRRWAPEGSTVTIDNPTGVVALGTFNLRQTRWRRHTVSTLSCLDREGHGWQDSPTHTVYPRLAVQASDNWVFPETTLAIDMVRSGPVRGRGMCGDAPRGGQKYGFGVPSGLLQKYYGMSV